MNLHHGSFSADNYKWRDFPFDSKSYNCNSENYKSNIDLGLKSYLFDRRTNTQANVLVSFELLVHGAMADCA